MSSVKLVYHRPPRRTDTFEQERVAVEGGCHITLLEHTPLPRPVEIDGITVLHPGATVVWFTFEGCWHDIGRFHTLDGEFTGYYANIITPVRLHTPLNWECTDLAVDVWLGRDGECVVLDAEELAEAERNQWVDKATAERARIEVDQIRAAAALGVWPPRVAQEWTLERVHAHLGRAPNLA